MKGQSTTEYAVILAIAAAALLSMQVYIKRGIQGKIRDLADQISPVQYEQGQTTSYFFTEQTGRTETSYDFGQSKTVVPEEWVDERGVTHRGEEVRKWGNEIVKPEIQETK